MIRMPNDRVSKSIVVAVVVATMLTSGYFAVAGLLDSDGLTLGGDIPAARTYAGYVAARSAVLLGAAGWLTATRSWNHLRLVLALNGVVQLLDAGLGAAHHNAAQTIGPAVFTVALFVAVALLARTGSTEGRQDQNLNAARVPREAHDIDA